MDHLCLQSLQITGFLTCDIAETHNPFRDSGMSPPPEGSAMMITLNAYFKRKGPR
jgi:hypothetical protein